MKLLLVAVLFVASLVMIHGACIGRPRTPSCHESRDEGHEASGAVGRRMWYYNIDTGACEQMNYKGAGGNDNRWCSKGDCAHHCEYERSSR